VTAATSLVASMSIAGVPPFSGFWSKLIIIVACVQGRHYVYAFLAALVSVVTLAMFMKVQRYAFYGEVPERWLNVREVPFSMKLAMVALSVMCVAGGVLLIPQVSGMFLDGATQAILSGTGYAGKVFGNVK